MKQQPTLETTRLILRPFKMSDATAVQKLAGDRSIADKVQNIPHPYEDGVAEEWISTHRPGFEAGELATFAAVLRTESELIGAIGLTIVPQFDRAVLGYWIGKPYWGNGYCTEAGRAIMKYGFLDLKLNRVYASHLTRNPVSGKVMQKLGMIHEGRLREHTKKWDVFEDLELYGILRHEWNENIERVV
jgi:RimJ/RimL family protein N-acetyltransferase